MNALSMLDGKKTYIAGLALVVYAIGGAVSGNLDWNTAVNKIIEAIAIIGIGHKIDKATA